MSGEARPARCAIVHFGFHGLQTVATSLDQPNSPVRRVRLFVCKARPVRRVRPDMLSTCQAGQLCVAVPFIGSGNSEA